MITVNELQDLCLHLQESHGVRAILMVAIQPSDKHPGGEKETVAMVNVTGADALMIAENLVLAVEQGKFKNAEAG